MRLLIRFFSWDLNDIRVVFPTWHGFLFECWNQEKASVPLKLWESNHTFFARGLCCDDVICWRVPTKFGSDFNTPSFLNQSPSNLACLVHFFQRWSRSNYSYRSAWNNWATVPGATGRVTKRRCLVAHGVVLQDDMGNMIFYCGAACPKSKALLWTSRMMSLLHCFISKLMVFWKKLDLETCMISRSDVAGLMRTLKSYMTCLFTVPVMIKPLGFCPTIRNRWFSMSSMGWGLGNSIDGNPGNPFAYLHCCAFCL